MKKINTAQLKQLVEAAIFVADKPISRQQLKETVLNEFSVADRTLSKVLNELKLDYQPRGIQLVEVASGFRFQSLDALSPWLSKLWQEKCAQIFTSDARNIGAVPTNQPITRGEIEQVRGVAVSSNIIKTLTERDWIKVVGHKEVPATGIVRYHKRLLDYFSMTSLGDLPNAEAFENMAESIASDSPLKVLNEAPSE